MYIIMNSTSSRVFAEEMKKLEDLSGSPLLDDKERKTRAIQQIFQRVKEATTSFQVRDLNFI